MQATKLHANTEPSPAATMAPIHDGGETTRTPHEAETVRLPNTRRSEQTTAAIDGSHDATIQPSGQPAPVETASRVGQLSGEFGRYHIVGLLGQGGMGAVNAAVDPDLDRKVAIKVPFFDGENQTGALDRFRREGKAIAALQHATDGDGPCGGCLSANTRGADRRCRGVAARGHLRFRVSGEAPARYGDR